MIFSRLTLSCLFGGFLGLSFVLPAFAADVQGMAVNVVKARSACFVDSVQMTGNIEPRDELLVRPDTEGMKIAKVLVEDGATVAEGQALLELSRPEWVPVGPTKLTISAPAGGLVLHDTLAIGMPASARGPALFRIIRDGDLELVAGIAQQDLNKVKPGQTARIAALNGTEFAGTVRSIEAQIDPLTQSAKARIQFRSQPSVKPGMFAKAWVDSARSCGATIPLSSLLYGAQGSVVQVVRNNRVETKLVRVGTTSGKDVQIQEGIGPGELIVARAGAFLREGDPVRPMLLDLKR